MKLANRNGSLRGWEHLSMVRVAEPYADDFTFFQRLVYSAAIDRAANRRKVTIRGIANDLKMKRDTVRDALSHLVKMQLITVFQNGSYFMRVPPEGMFVPRKGGGAKWQQKLAYVSLLYPAEGSGLDMRDSGVYGLLRSITIHKGPGTPLSDGYLAKLLGMDRQTVAARLSKLSKLKLVKIQRNFRGFTATVLIWSDSHFRVLDEKQDVAGAAA